MSNPTRRIMIRLHMSAREIALVLGALSFLEGESMVDHDDRAILKVLVPRLEALVNDQP